jgi:xanthine dehydrogenase accessory factor
VREWPDAYLSRVALSPRDAVCILTHDVKFDVPAIEAALRSPVGYIGAMGSQKTHARRVERLRESGVSEEQLARISAPIGLDIGAKTPPEVALSIAAELVARRRQGARSSASRKRPSAA